MASESLAFYPVFAFFILTIVHRAGIEVDACLSLLYLCDVLTVLQDIGRGRATHELLKAVMDKYLTQYLAVYGERNMIFKHHQALHLPDMMRRHGALLSCWVHERRHRLAKRHADNIDNTSIDFERSVLIGVTSQTIKQLRDARYISVRVGLQHPVRRCTQHFSMELCTALAVPLDADVYSSNTTRYSPSGLCSKHDVVLFISDGLRCGIVLMHVEIEAEPMTCVSVWEKRGPNADGAGVWAKTHNPVFVWTDTIIATPIWCPIADDAVRVLLPIGHR
jgi:hypothetical protein